MLFTWSSASIEAFYVEGVRSYSEGIRQGAQILCPEMVRVS